MATGHKRLSGILAFSRYIAQEIKDRIEFAFQILLLAWHISEGARIANEHYDVFKVGVSVSPAHVFPHDVADVGDHFLLATGEKISVTVS